MTREGQGTPLATRTCGGQVTRIAVLAACGAPAMMVRRATPHGWRVCSAQTCGVVAMASATSTRAAP